MSLLHRVLPFAVMAALREVGSLNPALETGNQAQKSDLVNIVCSLKNAGPEFEYLRLL